MTTNKNHWYDGWIYDTFIAPNQDSLFHKIKNYIEPNSKIIDVGCGTGRFSFLVTDKCEFVLGIDLSKRNIDRANLNLSKTPLENISFQHLNVNDLVQEGANLFDCAVLTYVIHEVDEADRVNLLTELSKIADKIIIGDYQVPMPKGLWNLLIKTVEFFAGTEHYRNFKSYVANGGIHYLASKAGLKINYEMKNNKPLRHIVVLSK